MPEQATRYIKASLSLQIHKPVLPARNRTCSFFFVVSWLVAFKKETHSGTRTLSFLIKAQDTTVFKSKGAPNMQTRVFTCDRQTEDSLPTPESVAESPPLLSLPDNCLMTSLYMTALFPVYTDVEYFFFLNKIMVKCSVFFSTGAPSG